MDGETTSRAVARPGPGVWAEWALFVRAPRLPVERVRFGWGAIGEIGWLLLLNLLVALPLAAGLTWLAGRTGLRTPEFEVLTRQGPVVTLLVGALMLPMLEEVVFRGWLDGWPRHFAVTVAVVGLAAGILLAFGFRAVGGGLVGVGAGSLLLWARRAGTQAPRWFAANFAWFYFASALLFGLAHMTNYSLDRPWLLLPFVLPQTFAGLLFGFARVRHGMWANIALHSTSNAMLLALTLAGV